MKKIKYLVLVVLCFLCMAVNAQQTSLMEQMKSMSKESDPEKNVALMNKIIAENKLDAVKDAEPIDVLKGNVALAFLRKGKYAAFKKYIGGMKSKFNQTSYMNMAASMLVKEGKDTKMAEQLAKETIDLYLSYKDDPRAKPADMSVEDWKRFMGFAQYPYYDTYASALFANGRFKDALMYQEKAFNGPVEEGLAPSVERYARLLALTGKQDKAYELLETLTRTGKSTAAMDTQLKELYTRKHGDAKGFEEYLSKLQQGVQSAVKETLKAKMLDSEAPGFTLKDLNGKQVSLADLKGKIVVLDFWATWCVPCIASFPAMQKMVSKHRDVIFLFIATQEKEEGALARVKSFLEKNKYSFNVLMDEATPGKTGSYRVVSSYKVKGIPTKAVIDKKGRLRFMSSGFSSDSELVNELEAMIDLAKEQS